MRIQSWGAFALLFTVTFFIDLPAAHCEDKEMPAIVIRAGSTWVGQQGEIDKVDRMEHAPLIKHGVTYVSSRDMAHWYGKDLQWNAKQKQLELGKLTFSNPAQSNGLAYVSVEGRTYVPLRDTLSQLGQQLYVYDDLLAIGEPLSTSDVDIYKMNFLKKTPYRVRGEKQEQGFDTMNLAIRAASKESTVVRNAEGEPIFNSSTHNYVVMQGNKHVASLPTFSEAYAVANQYADASFIHESGKTLWTSGEETPAESRIIDVPLVLQNPELPRGCEVTSLAMLLQWRGTPADKLQLAREVQKVPFQTVGADGRSYRGHMNDGFVGDMYSLTTSGIGVYHKPIVDLAEQYAPNHVIDMTGAGWSAIEAQLAKDRPVWVIVSSTFGPLPASQWQTWQTTSGPVQISYRQHSVVVTGYDENTVYIKDPFGYTSQTNKHAFIAGWEQFGQQAVTLVK
ncbi:C39 family peptidase [Aureibacillus halotolerans]|uniref:Uncharacterized protein YvpB n=1 Tax=Aureibacillus halotolerans TaxID=1508390 RepID=A0A4V3D4X5_9BACI|nr:C39 family peptidase [Aureibacillus halotolerans]TDQ37707.1 uncharacterized protein YvpB [Aureibacillus halotolerans]